MRSSMWNLINFLEFRRMRVWMTYVSVAVPRTGSSLTWISRESIETCTRSLLRITKSVITTLHHVMCIGFCRFREPSSVGGTTSSRTVGKLLPSGKTSTWLSVTCSMRWTIIWAWSCIHFKVEQKETTQHNYKTPHCCAIFKKINGKTDFCGINER